MSPPMASDPWEHRRRARVGGPGDPGWSGRYRKVSPYGQGTDPPSSIAILVFKDAPRRRSKTDASAAFYAPLGADVRVRDHGRAASLATVHARTRTGHHRVPDLRPVAR